MVVPSLSVSPYVAAERRWRGAQEAALRREDGWPSLVGLAWLGDGIASLGAAGDCTIRLRGLPARLGTAVLWNGRVALQVEPASGATLNGRRFESATLRSDAQGAPDRVRVGSLTLTVIERGKRIGFRVSDSEAPRREAFRSLRWYPVDARYRIDARFIPYRWPKALWITNVLGDVRRAECPGYAEFRVAGKTVRLDAEGADGGLFFNFRDATSGRETYGAGRFLDAEGPKKGRVVLDFNRATNPPCAFTDYATCPLPPRQNSLSVPIRAGALNGHSPSAD